MELTPYKPADRAQALHVALRAWRPVFEHMREAVPGFVYDNFYPDGWEARQIADLGAVLDDNPDDITVATMDDQIVGWISIKIHPEDNMGEIHVVCVDPAYQRQGIGKRLMDHAHQAIRQAGMGMVMVETGGDPGHATAQTTYEAAGYQRWPVARYFKDLTD